MVGRLGREVGGISGDGELMGEIKDEGSRKSSKRLVLNSLDSSLRPLGSGEIYAESN